MEISGRKLAMSTYSELEVILEQEQGTRVGFYFSLQTVCAASVPPMRKVHLTVKFSSYAMQSTTITCARLFYHMTDSAILQ